MSDPPWAPWRWPDEPEHAVRTGPGAVAPDRSARERAGRFPRVGHGSRPDPAPAARLGHVAPSPTVRPGSRHDASRGRSPAARRWGVGGGLRPPAAAVGRPAGACPIGRRGRHGIARCDVPEPERPRLAPSAGPTRRPSQVREAIWITTGTMGTPRNGHTAVRLLDGRVLVLGGSSDGSGVTSAQLYDPFSGTWTATASMANPREGDRHAAGRRPGARGGS